jgi:hypothetical protein
MLIVSPKGVLYASSSTTSNAKARLESAIFRLIASVPTLESDVESPMTASKPSLPKILYSVYYEQKSTSSSNAQSGRVCSLASSSLDLAFDDTTLDYVEDAWKMVMSLTAGDDVSRVDMLDSYMVFEDREGGEGNDE